MFRPFRKQSFFVFVRNASTVASSSVKKSEIKLSKLQKTVQQLSDNLLKNQVNKKSKATLPFAVNFPSIPIDSKHEKELEDFDKYISPLIECIDKAKADLTIKSKTKVKKTKKTKKTASKNTVNINAKSSTLNVVGPVILNDGVPSKAYTLSDTDFYTLPFFNSFVNLTDAYHRYSIILKTLVKDDLEKKNADVSPKTIKQLVDKSWGRLNKYQKMVFDGKNVLIGQKVGKDLLLAVENR